MSTISTMGILSIRPGSPFPRSPCGLASALLLICAALAGCESRPRAGDTDPPAILASDRSAGRVIFSSDTGIAARPSSCASYILSPNHVIESFPARIAVAAADRSGVARIQVSIPGRVEVTDVAPSSVTVEVRDVALGDRIAPYTFIAAEWAIEPGRTIRELVFTLPRHANYQLGLRAYDGAGATQGTGYPLWLRSGC